MTQGHTQRLKDMLQEAKEAGCEVLSGGSALVDVDQRYVPTSLIRVNPAANPKHAGLRILKEEIFGGILPIMSYSDTESCIDYINAMKGTPLALYVFSTSTPTFEKIANECPSGGLCRNELLLHFATASLPFGGLGTSGYTV